MSDSNKEKKSNLPKFKFSSYWIYGAVFIAIIAFQFFNSGDLASKSISKNKFEEILQDNDIEEIVIVNKDVAQIYLTAEALKKGKHAKHTSSSFYRPGSPVYEYNFGDLRTFEENVAILKKEKGLVVDIDNKEKTSILDAIFGFLPFIILIAVWLFFMKRMSGGAGGSGGGGQIFSIGKSKAKLFDNDTKVKTTFENVAGLEGA